MGCGASNTASVAAGASDSSIIDPEEKEKTERGKQFVFFSAFPISFPVISESLLLSPLSAFHFHHDQSGFNYMSLRSSPSSYL